MTESEIREAIDLLVAKYRAANTIRGPIHPSIEAAILGLAIKLVAQVFVDLHRIADAAEVAAQSIREMAAQA